MQDFENAKCPNCLKKASGIEEVEKLFGFIINEGIKMRQSWCKECR